MRYKIKIKDVFYFFMIIFLFEPAICVKYRLTNAIFIFGGLLSFISIFYIFYKNSLKINKMIIILIFYRILLLIMTLIFDGDILKIGYISLVCVSLFMYAELFKLNNEFDKFIKILNSIIFTYVLINVCCYVIFPQGLYTERIIDKGYHFLGIRTRFSEYSIALIVVAMTSFYMGNIGKNKLFIAILLAAINVFLPKIATAITGIGIIIVVYVMLNLLTKHKKEKCIINYYNSLFYIAMIITILIVFFRIQTLFSYYIEKILHKSVSLTGRTTIWDCSYKYIFDKFLLIGHGYPKDNGSFILINSTYWQAHNQLLQLLYESGIIGTLLFYSIIKECFTELNKKNNISISFRNFYVASLFAILIMMITEIYGYYIPIYVIFAVILFLPDKLKGE